MFFCTKKSESIFQFEFRHQVLAALTINIMTFCHGTGLGWFAPMVAKFLSATDTPLNFTTTVAEISWIGAVVNAGGCVGNIIFGQMLDRFGRKFCIYCIALPHMCFWLLLFFATSNEYLHVARVCLGLAGGGTYVVVPIFIGEIADPNIRGRLTSLFQFTYNCGMLSGYILASHVPYHIIPCVVIGLPVVYVLLALFFPETPPHLLRCGKDELAKKSLQFYMNVKLQTKESAEQFNDQFKELRADVLQQKLQTDGVRMRDFLSKRALRALSICIILMFIIIFTGPFALLNYTSSIFVTVKTELHPDTNTIIIGVVQLVGTCIAIIVVDRYGRKILLIVSTAFMSLGITIFGIYAYFAENLNVDLTPYSSWLPLLLMVFIILMANIGVMPVPFVLMVEILPSKIRSTAMSICIVIFNIFGFSLLKGFPLFMESYGLALTMWVCAGVAIFGLVFVITIIKETKGISVNKVEPID